MALTKQENTSITRLFDIIKLMRNYSALACFDNDIVYLSSTNINLPVEVCAILDPDTTMKLAGFNGLLTALSISGRFKEFGVKKRDRFEKIDKGYSLFSIDKNAQPLVFNIMDLNTPLKADESIADKNNEWNPNLGKKEELTEEMKVSLGIDKVSTVRDRVLHTLYDVTGGEWIPQIKRAVFEDITNIDEDAIQKLINKKTVHYQKDDFYVILSKELFPRIKSDTKIGITEIGEEPNKKIGIIREICPHVTIYTYFKTRKWNTESIKQV